MQKEPSIIKGALLVAGTSIGGGILALPVLTAPAGFIPSIAIYLVCWLCMAATGLLFLEVSQWMKGESNFISMADYTLGWAGKYFAWGLYLFLFYSLTIAYMVGCGRIFLELLPAGASHWMGPLFFTALFAPLILISTCLATRLNLLLFTGLALSYLGFVVFGVKYVKTEQLAFSDWSQYGVVLPIAFTSFAYQGIVPTLASYMDHRASKVRYSILIGSFIPFIAYFIWQGLILGIVPLEGAEGLRAAAERGENAVLPLRFFLSGSWLYVLGQSFAFFALITSFLGVSIGLRDFLSDGLGLQNKGRGRWILAALVLCLPLVVSLFYPDIFLIALEYAGGVGCALLLGFLPILMCWSGRYRMHLRSDYQLFGGRFLLVLLAFFILFEVFHEIWK